jgi:hypothetical protein
MGGVGVRRLDASANHSSEKERTLPPRVEDIRSGRGVSRHVMVEQHQGEIWIHEMMNHP